MTDEGEKEEEHRLVPFDRREEVLHVSTRSLYLAGFVLTFLGLILNKEQGEVTLSATLLLLIFFILLGVSEYVRGADTQQRAQRGEIAYDIATLLLIIPGLAAYFETLSVELCSSYTVVIALFAFGYTLVKLHHIHRSCAAIKE